MYFTLTASKDTYITDKIIESKFSASNANVGHASTIDLFRLYDESSLSGTITTNELTRALIKFDYGRINKLKFKELNLNSSNFECRLELFDIMGGQVTPTNFTLIVFPLSQSFDEGRGKDVVNFADLDSANFITASVSNGVVSAWHASGANAQGAIIHPGTYPANIDIIVSGNLSDGEGSVGLGKTQTFVNGGENLSIDVTKIVSATIAGIIPNHGFRLSFTGSEEQDNKTKFVKRFASRHVRDPLLRPKLTVSYDNTVLDNHRNFEFNVSGTLFLNNFHRGKPASILSGASLTPVTGTNCLLLCLRTGSFVRYFTGSQHQAGTREVYTNKGGESYSYVTGVYSATLALPYSDTTTVAFNTTLTQMAARTGSVTFETYWSSLEPEGKENARVGYHTGSLVIKKSTTTGFDYVGKEIDLIVINARSIYSATERIQFRVFGREFVRKERAHRVPYRRESLIFNEVYYRILDVDTRKILVPFKQDNNGTRLSTDSTGMFFEMYMDTLAIGRNYTFEFLVIDHGFEEIIEAKNVSFRVTK